MSNFTTFKALWNDNAVRSHDAPEVLFVQAYRWHKQNFSRPYGDLRPVAQIAISKARADVAAGKRRYPATKTFPAVSWQPVKPHPTHSERLAHVDNPERVGLRHVGDVTSDCGRRKGFWQDRGVSGWYTDPQGEVSDDNMGLCYGVVYQLPARKGEARFVAGYQFGGTDKGPTLDFRNVFVGNDGNCAYEGSKGNPAARDAARIADQMAQVAAEREREWQTAWQAGSKYAEALEDVKGYRAAFYKLNAERREARKAMNGASLPTICETIADALSALAANIERARGKMEKLAGGDYPRFEFYPDADAIAAFNDGAGMPVLK